MKTLKTFAFALAFATSSLAFAGTHPEKNVEPKSIGQVMADILSQPEVDINFDQRAAVEFFVNDDKEIVVVSVQTRNKRLEKFIKSRLNFEKVSGDNVKTNENLVVHLKFKNLN